MLFMQPCITIKYMEILKPVFESNYSLESCVVCSDLFIAEVKTTANERTLRSKRKGNKVKVSFTYKRKRQKRNCKNLLWVSKPVE